MFLRLRLGSLLSWQLEGEERVEVGLEEGAVSERERKGLYMKRWSGYVTYGTVQYTYNVQCHVFAANLA